jgi:hypothetical protein
MQIGIRDAFDFETDQACLVAMTCRSKKLRLAFSGSLESGDGTQAMPALTISSTVSMSSKNI